MNLPTLNLVLAQAAGATQQDPRAQLFSTIGMFAIMGVMFYFVLIRPQQKRAKEQATLLKAIKPGDEVITSSGIIGRVITVRDNSVTLRSEETKLEFIKSAVTEITKRDGDASKA